MRFHKANRLIYSFAISFLLLSQGALAFEWCGNAISVGVTPDLKLTSTDRLRLKGPESLSNYLTRHLRHQEALEDYFFHFHAFFFTDGERIVPFAFNAANSQQFLRFKMRLIHGEYPNLKYIGTMRARGYVQKYVPTNTVTGIQVKWHEQEVLTPLFEQPDHLLPSAAIDKLESVIAAISTGFRRSVPVQVLHQSEF